jgi:RGM family protein
MDRCSGEYERAMDDRDIPNPEPSAEFCQIAIDYGTCLRGSARSCRGNLNYHSTLSTIGRLAAEFNCPRLLTNSSASAAHVPLPSSSAAPPRTAGTPPAPKRECTYQGRRRFRHCGLFGDPHLKTFKNQYQTCRVRGAWPLIDNPYLGVQVTNEPVVEGSPATATTKVSASSSHSTSCARR